MRRIVRVMAASVIVIMGGLGLSSLHASGKYALVYGCSDDHLQTSIDADAYNMCSALMNTYGFPADNIRMRLTSETSVSVINDDLAWIATKDPGTLVFFFSGHGNGPPDYSESFFWAKDGAIYTSDLNDHLSTIDAGEKVVIINSCHSGGFAYDCASSSSQDPVFVLAACDETQNTIQVLLGVTPGGIWGSVFGSWLVDAMQYYNNLGWEIVSHLIFPFPLYPLYPDTDWDGEVSLREAFEYADWGTRSTWTSFGGLLQNPIMRPETGDTALPVELIHLVAMHQQDGTVLVKWETASETQNAGWNILCRPADKNRDWQIINKRRIRGGGTSPFGESYEFVDSRALPKNGYVYKLEWISTDGVIEHSPEIACGRQKGISGAVVEVRSEDGDGSSAPSRVSRRLLQRWRPRENTDYLVITPESLAAAVEPLLSFRSEQGHEVGLSTLTGIRKKFPGLSGQKAIREFLLSTYGKTGSLRNVLFAGDAAVASDGSQKHGKGLVPTFVVEMKDVGQVSTDYPYSCLAGDDFVADVAIGRLPATTSVGMKTLVDKIIHYEENLQENRNVTFAIGDYVHDGDEYAETSSECLISLYCRDYDVTRVYSMPKAPELQKYVGGTAELMAAFENSCGWLEFRGHGAGDLWGGLLGANGALDMKASGSIPIVTSTSCFTGSFADPKGRLSIGEALVRNPEGGAIAFVGNTGHGMIFAGHAFSEEVWTELQQGVETLGEVVLNAKRTLASESAENEGFLHSINLIGDPATSIALAR